MRDRGASRGLLTITVMDDGSAVHRPRPPGRAPQGRLGGEGGPRHPDEWAPAWPSSRAARRAPPCDGQAVALDLPPRVSGREWLVSRDFLGKGLPRLAPGVSLALPTEARKPATKTVQAAVPLEELRFRSYPSFTRIVVETGGRLAYAVVEPATSEVRVRLPGLSLSRAARRGDRRRARAGGAAGAARAPTPCCASSSRAPPGEVEGSPSLQDPLPARARHLPARRRPRTGEPRARRAAAAPPDRARRRPRRPRPGRHRARPGSQEKEVVLDVTRRVAQAGRGRGSASRWC